MAVFKKSQKQITEANRQRRLGTKRQSTSKPEFSRLGLISTLIFVVFASLAILICFVGLSSAGPLVQKDQVSRLRITSEIPFSYESQILTEKRMEAQRQKIPPVFLLDLQPFRDFRDYLTVFIKELSDFAQVPENAPAEIARIKPEEVNVFLSSYTGGNPYNLRPADVATFYNQLNAARQTEILTEGLILLNEIYQRGVYGNEAGLSATSNGSSLSFFRVQDEAGNIQEVEILSEEEALRSLRINIAALDIPRESTVALFRILRAGLNPNLRFDEESTTALITTAQESLKPVIVNVASSETIIEPNTRVNALQYEQLQAYRKALRNSQRSEFGFDPLLLERSLLTMLIVFAAAFYLRITKVNFHKNLRVFIFSIALILFNLLLIRLVLETGDSAIAQSNPIFVRIIPFLVPVIIGPITITILVGPRPGILAAGLISVFNAMMHGNNLSVIVISFLVCLVGIYYCRNIQLRASLVRAGLISGMVLALGAGFAGFRDNLDIVTILYQLLASLGNGLISGILIVGLLPILEQLFRYTTDITLLEMTDFNHPLLRKMQVEAPGSYHHSLMVANLSENAAAAIGANPLVCRVCSLFHDVGKMVKPEYFAENQRAGQNPHIERNPSMSALVIKSHIKEGLQLAKEYKLPKIISDVICQHHGTSLIQYFYYKALEQQRSENMPSTFGANAPRIELDKVNEATYRYEGPIPQFTESAIIMLADSVEAASRSLRKVTPQSIDELLEKIITARLEDGQLNATPVTFSQLAKIKESFAFTLLNMLHARVEYPDAASESEKRARKKLARKRQNDTENENDDDSPKEESSVAVAQETDADSESQKPEETSEKST